MIHKVTFNELQQVFINRIEKAFNDKETGMILLNAAGGTGKTFISLYLKNQYKSKVRILAPTHKACSLYPPKTCSTIHGFFGAKLSYTDNGDQEYKFNALASKISQSIIIVDECSMISLKMFEAFKQLSSKVLFIFTGDIKQIPPVNEDKSVIFNSGLETFTLTQSMRSRDSRVGYYNKIFGNAVENPNVSCIQTDYVNEDELFGDFIYGFDTIVLAWTNSQVSTWNNKIRDKLYRQSKDVLEDYYVDEKLVFSGCRNVNGVYSVNSYVSSILEMFKETEDIETSHIYYSNDIITIFGIEQVEYFIPYLRCHHSKDNVVNKCNFCCIKNGHRQLGHDIRFYKIQDNRGVYWYIPVTQDKGKLQKILTHYKEHVLMMPFSLRNPEWVAYYRLHDRLMSDLNYCYASTIHKAQGSQWDNVYVDIVNIRRSQQDANRLAYTAVSRAVKNIFFVN